jgi:hypothetical protein
MYRSIGKVANRRASIAGFFACLTVLLLCWQESAFAQRHVSGRLLTYDSAAVLGAFVAIGKSGASGYLCTTKTDGQGYFWFDITDAISDIPAPGKPGLLELYFDSLLNSSHSLFVVSDSSSFHVMF